MLATACRSRLGTHTLQALEAVVAQQQGEPASGGKGGEGGKRLQLHGEAAELLEQASVAAGGLHAPLLTYHTPAGRGGARGTAGSMAGRGRSPGIIWTYGGATYCTVRG